MKKAVRFVVSAGCGMLVASLGLYLFGLSVAFFSPPRSVAVHSELYGPVHRFMVWVPLIAICALAIVRVARSRAALFGVVAAAFGLVALALQTRSFGVESTSPGGVVSLVTTYWLEILLLVVVLPTLCLLWRPTAP